MNYSANELLKRAMQVKGFKEIPEDYWIIGIRNPQDTPDAFDDVFYLMKGTDLIMETTGTTNPGKKILKGGFRSYNSKGGAIVQSDRWYYDLWAYGKHKGIVPALRQVGAIYIHRDGDMDDKSEELGKAYVGNHYGINFHSASKDFNSNLVKTVVGGWSAGCQVCNNLTDYRKIINTIKDSNQKRVTYLLLKEFSI